MFLRTWRSQSSPISMLADRQQTVIETAVYGIHPMYAGVALEMIGMSLWLESYAAAF